MNDDALQLEAGEQIVLVAHRHFINIFPIFLATGLVLLASIFITGWLTLNQASFSFIPAAMVSTVFLALDALSVVISVVAFLVFRQTRIVLTNLHFVQIIQAGLFGRSLSKFSLDELQDVKGERRGFFATILNYGWLHIETAGAQENFKFGPVGNPLGIAEVINDTHEAFERAHTFERP